MVEEALEVQRFTRGAVARRRQKMMISVWWVIVAAFIGMGLGMLVFALMTMAGSEPMQLPPDAVAEPPAVQ
jgi:hypothetical protein